MHNKSSTVWLIKMNEHQIINKIKSLENQGFIFEKNADESEYILTKNTYQVKIDINPQKWIGIEFYLKDSQGKNIIRHDINTDLYPISESKYSDFAKDISDEIVEFLDSLEKNKIRVGKQNNKLVVVIPKKNKYLLIKKGFIFTSGTYYEDLQDIKDYDKLEQLPR